MRPELVGRGGLFEDLGRRRLRVKPSRAVPKATTAGRSLRMSTRLEVLLDKIAQVSPSALIVLAQIAPLGIRLHGEHLVRGDQEPAAEVRPTRPERAAVLNNGARLALAQSVF
jgi:hypothetical protein